MIGLAQLVEGISIFSLLVSFHALDEFLHEYEQGLKFISQSCLYDGLIVQLYLYSFQVFILLGAFPIQHALQVFDILDHVLILLKALSGLTLLLLDILQPVFCNQKLILKHISILL